MSQPAGDKPSLKGAWSWSRDQLSNFPPPQIPSEGLKLQTSNFVHGLATRSTILQVTNRPLNGRVQGHVTNSYRASICDGGLGSRNSVRLSVRLSVCLSLAWIVTKLN